LKENGTKLRSFAAKALEALQKIIAQFGLWACSEVRIVVKKEM
jgi:hypothetical protein